MSSSSLPPNSSSRPPAGAAKRPPAGPSRTAIAPKPIAPAAASASAQQSHAGQKRRASSISSPSSSVPGTPGTPKSGLKRPYRRTKRPAGYNDRSTVTTVTPKAVSEAAAINEYDLVMAEAEDLLNASLQAQKMGRLKMASAYQLLLHTRLVGLGKRVDRSIMPAASGIAQKWPRNNKEGGKSSDDNNNLQQRPSMGSRLAAASEEREAKTEAVHTAVKAPPPNNNSNGATVSQPEEQDGKQIIQQLSSILPQDAEMDASMMEHLARAAAELHHQRTGRRRTSDGLLANNNTLNALAAMKNAPQSQVPVRPPPTPPRITKSAVTSSHWSQAEIDIVNKGITKKWQPETIANILHNKNETQVRAFLAARNIVIEPNAKPSPAPEPQPKPSKPSLSATRNRKEPARSVPNAAGGGALASSSTKAAAASIAQNISTAGGGESSILSSPGGTNELPYNPTHVPEVVAASVVGGIPLDAASPGRNKKGGRGRKPATTAMNTVATVSLDIKALLKSNKQHDGSSGGK